MKEIDVFFNFLIYVSLYCFGCRVNLVTKKCILFNFFCFKGDTMRIFKFHFGRMNYKIRKERNEKKKIKFVLKRDDLPQVFDKILSFFKTVI